MHGLNMTKCNMIVGDEQAKQTVHTLHLELSAVPPLEEKKTTQKSNAPDQKIERSRHKGLCSIPKPYGLKTKSRTRMGSYGMATRNGQFLAQPRPTC